MKSDKPDWKLPQGRFQPPSRDDLLAAGSALVRRSLASSTPPTASEPVHRAATIGTRSGVGAVGGYGGVKGSSRGNVGYRQGRQVDVTSSGEIQVRLYNDWGSEDDRGQLKGCLDNDSGVRAAGGYWDWDTEGCSSDDERDDSVETEEEIASLERRLAAMKDELAWLEMQNDASMVPNVNLHDRP